MYMASRSQYTNACQDLDTALFEHNQDNVFRARLEACVKPFAEHLNCVRNAVEEVLQTNLAADARASLQGVMRYMNSFRCILMASVWFKVLSAIDQRNKVLQAKDQTVDVEVANIKSLLADLDGLRSKWDTILSECQLVTQVLPISSCQTLAAGTIDW